MTFKQRVVDGRIVQRRLNDVGHDFRHDVRFVHGNVNRVRAELNDGVGHGEGHGAARVALSIADVVVVMVAVATIVATMVLVTLVMLVVVSESGEGEEGEGEHGEPCELLSVFHSICFLVVIVGSLFQCYVITVSFRVHKVKSYFIRTHYYPRY